MAFEEKLQQVKRGKLHIYGILVPSVSTLEFSSVVGQAYVANILEFFVKLSGSDIDNAHPRKKKTNFAMLCRGLSTTLLSYVLHRCQSVP